MIAFNENYANKFIRIRTGTDGNLPINDVRAVAIDNRNQVWIGTARGLRYIPSVDSFISETEIESKPIIILDPLVFSVPSFTDGGILLIRPEKRI